MTEDHPEEAGVPVDELKELVAEWSETSTFISAGRRATELAKARELQELVEQYE